LKKIYRHMDFIIQQATRITSLLSVVFLVLIIAMVLKESLHIFEKVNFIDFIFGMKWKPLSDPPQLGIRNMIMGTLYTSSIALLISIPISIGASVFISLNTKGKTRMVILSLIDLMAGIPSVVYGFFSFMTLVLFFERKLLFASGESFFIAGMTLAWMVLPLMVSTITQTMDKVRNKYNLSAKALGVSPSFMTVKLLIPASTRGIITAILLAFSRALGETMAVLMVIGNSNLMPSFFGKGITMSGLITLEMGSAVLKSNHYHGLYAVGFVLMLVLIIVNVIFGFIKKSVEEYV